MLFVVILLIKLEREIPLTFTLTARHLSPERILFSLSRQLLTHQTPPKTSSSLQLKKQKLNF